MTNDELRIINHRRLQRARDRRERERAQFEKWCVRHGDWAALDAFSDATERIYALYREYYDMVALEYT